MCSSREWLVSKGVTQDRMWKGMKGCAGPRPSGKVTLASGAKVAGLVFCCPKVTSGFQMLYFLISLLSAPGVVVYVCPLRRISILIWWYPKKKSAWPLLKIDSPGKLEISALSSAVPETRLSPPGPSAPLQSCLPLWNQNSQHPSPFHQMEQPWP